MSVLCTYRVVIEPRVLRGTAARLGTARGRSAHRAAGRHWLRLWLSRVRTEVWTVPSIAKVFVPAFSHGTKEDDLRLLSGLIDALGLSEACHSSIAGERAYGADYYENDTFLLHCDCGCGKDDCPWCEGCDCDEHFFIDGQEVSGGEWFRFRRFKLRQAKYGTPEYEATFEEVQRRTATHIDGTCPFCTGTGVAATKGGEPGKHAPNFWFKGEPEVKAWWYKWIGRDMEWNREVGDQEWQSIIRDCLWSLLE